MSGKALIIRHVPHEGVAGYREPIESAGFLVDRIDVTDPAFPALDLCEPDLLIMMGGPMGSMNRRNIRGLPASSSSWRGVWRRIAPRWACASARR
jgi:hypothetical protein